MLLQQSDFGALHQAIPCLHVNMTGLHSDGVWSSERPPVNGETAGRRDWFSACYAWPRVI